MTNFKNMQQDQKNILLLTCSVFASTFGSGLFITGGTLYFIKVILLNENAVGVGTSVALAVALCIMYPIGKLTDRFGGNKVYGISLLAQGTALLGVSTSPQLFNLYRCGTVLGLSDRSQNAATGGLIA